MVDRVSKDMGSESISPQDKAMFRQQHEEALNLFTRALDDYSHAKNMFQKAEFKDVMDKAMHVLKETAGQLKQKEWVKQNETLEKDLQAFENEENTANLTQLKRDLATMKSQIG